ncbi:hypothetical protein ACHAWF_017495 [Thalassiosira exigua]
MEATPTVYTGEKGFRDQRDVYILTIDHGVDEIKDDAFVNCWNLEKVLDLGSVSRIGKWSFYECKKLASIHLPDTVDEVDECAFNHCTALADVKFGKGRLYIKRRAFVRCPLETVTFGNVATIGDSAFAECGSLRTIKFGEGIYYIGRNAFAKHSRVAIDISGDYLRYQWPPFKITIPPNSFVVDNSRIRFCKGSTLESVNPDGQIIASGKLGEMSPHQILEVGERLRSIMRRQGESNEEKLGRISFVIDRFKMVEATSSLILAIKKSNIDTTGNQDVESIIVGGALSFLKSDKQWFYV